MNTEHAIASRHDDIVFENRNKEYGAYLIRREYDSNLSKGTFASFLFVACLFGVAYGAMMLRTDIVTMLPHRTEDGGLIPKPIIIADAKPVVHTSPSVKADLPPKVVSTNVADLPPVETQTTASTGNENGPPVEAGPGVVEVGGPVIPTVIEQPKTIDIAEVMPEFEGGTKALYRFLRKTLQYPNVSQRIGEEGTVFVRFVIDVTGSVTGIEVLKSVSSPLDKEASRVIAKMPKWKPGKQHGAPVNVRMVLPIKFEFNKE